MWLDLYITLFGLFVARFQFNDGWTKTELMREQVEQAF